MSEIWWTEADDAEIDIAVWELVSVAESHKGCEACAGAKSRGHNFCAPFTRAVEALCEWKERRSLLSRAEFYRAMHNGGWR